MSYRSNRDHWPLELTLHLAHFLVDHYLIDYRGIDAFSHGHFDAFQKQMMCSLGLSETDYSSFREEALKLEGQYRFSSMSSVFEYCIDNSSIELRNRCLEHALTCKTERSRSQETVREAAKRYGLHPDSHNQSTPLQVVYGADFLTRRSPQLLLPIILVFDHILSDEGIIFSNEERESKVSDDFRTLKREGVLVDYDWARVCDSVLFRDDRTHIRNVEVEAEEFFLRDASDEDRSYAPLMASHGYATSLKLAIPSLILPGDEVPNAFISSGTSRSLPDPAVVSNFWILEALTCVLDNFALSNIPMEEMLEIRDSVRSADAHAEFRELALLQIGSLKDDLRGMRFDEVLKEIQFQVRTDFQPVLARLQRELRELDRKRKRKFLTKVRQEGASLTFNLLGLLLGPDRNKALVDMVKTLYSGAESSLAIKTEIPHGFAFSLNLSQELEKTVKRKMT